MKCLQELLKKPIFASNSIQNEEDFYHNTHFGDGFRSNLHAGRTYD